MPSRPWQDIPDLRLAPDAKILSADALILRDNPLSLGGVKAFSREENVPSSVGYHDVILDAAMNWHDRFILVTGWVRMSATSEGFFVGGTQDKNIEGNYSTWDNTATDLATFSSFDFMYSENGSANFFTHPCITKINTIVNSRSTYIWVSAGGNLMLTWYESGVTTDFCAINIMVSYSDQMTP